jgi:hypothetical protein
MSENRMTKKSIVINKAENPEYAAQQKLICQQDAMETIRNAKSFILIANMGETTKCTGGVDGTADTILMIKGLQASLTNLKEKVMRDMESIE